MPAEIKLISTDFDGTLVAHARDPVLNVPCMNLIQQLQRDGAVWAINTGRSVDLLESGLTDFSFPFRPDFIVTSERDVFRPSENGGKWEAFGEWNERCAQDHADLFASASAVVSDVLDFVNQKTKARVLYAADGPEGLIASDEEEMNRVIAYIDNLRERAPKFRYQRNTVYLRFCHADYHKGAALGELARLLNISRENIFAAGDHHNDLSMLDGRFAAMPACPANAIPEVKNAVRDAAGYVSEKEHGAGVHDALLYFTS